VTLPVPQQPLAAPPAQIPETKIKGHPAAKTTKSKATFRFSSTVAGSRFTCKLDGKRKAACRSPKAYKGLKPGRHRFKVWATAGGRTDPTPARFSWKVRPPKR